LASPYKKYPQKRARAGITHIIRSPIVVKQRVMKAAMPPRDPKRMISLETPTVPPPQDL